MWILTMTIYGIGMWNGMGNVGPTAFTTEVQCRRELDSNIAKVSLSSEKIVLKAACTKII